jgi:hypothetical protein
LSDTLDKSSDRWLVFRPAGVAEAVCGVIDKGFEEEEEGLVDR